MTSLSIKLVLSAAGLAVLLAVPANAAERKYRAQVKAKPVRDLTTMACGPTHPTPSPSAPTCSAPTPIRTSATA